MMNVMKPEILAGGALFAGVLLFNFTGIQANGRVLAREPTGKVPDSINQSDGEQTRGPLKRRNSWGNSASSQRESCTGHRQLAWLLSKALLCCLTLPHSCKVRRASRFSPYNR